MGFDQKALGQRVKHLRREKNLTLEQMSSTLNISIDHLSRIELGKRIMYNKLRKLKRAKKKT
jgi:transcriptional regulator with XRE-family HTH domain